MVVAVVTEWGCWWLVVVLVTGPGAIAVVAVIAWGGCRELWGCLVIIFK